MLRHRVNRDDDLRTVFLEQLPHVPRSHSIEQVRLVRAKMFDRPVVILHQVLVMAQQVVVELRQLLGQQVGLLERADYVDQTLERRESPQPVCDRGRGASVAASGFGSDDQEFFGGFVSHWLQSSIFEPGRLAQILRWGSSQFWLLLGCPSVDVDLCGQYPIMLYRSRLERRLRLRRV